MMSIIKFKLRTAVLLAIVCLAILNVRAFLWHPFELEGQSLDNDLVSISGVVHVHTTLSDGRATPEQVIEAARAAGLSFVVITDHGTLDAKHLEGYHGDLLVIVGTETSTVSGHLLGVGIPDPDLKFSGNPRDTLEDIRDFGGSAVVAHPMSPHKDFRWSGWKLPGSWGLELINLDSMRRTTGWLNMLKITFLSGLNPRYAALRFLTTPEKTLKQWDTMLAKRDVAGFAGVDAHLAYELLFGLVKTHLFLDEPLSLDPIRDTAAILRALTDGRFYIGVDGLAPAQGFFAVIERKGERWSLGETIPLIPDLTLRAGGRLPRASRLRVLKDGIVATEEDGSVQLNSLKEGVYRIEVRLPGWDMPWILSNPIYVFTPDQIEARERRAGWPPEPKQPLSTEPLDLFEDASILSPEFDASSLVTFKIISSSSQQHGQGIGQMQFSLGVPTPEQVDTWCALVNRKQRDFSGKTGLTFAVKADGDYRFWAQVRDKNPTLMPDGTETWLSSVRASLDWRRITVRFSDMHSPHENSDGQLDLDKIQMLAFTMDPGSVKPGTTGTIWLDDLRVY